MPLELIKREDSPYWQVRGRIDEIPNGKYYRESTKKLNRTDAETYLADLKQSEIRKHYVGEEEVVRPFLFADAVQLYRANPEYAKFLLKVMPYLEHLEVSQITPKMVRDLGPQIAPTNSTDTWMKQVVSPVRAVINNAHELGKCGAISIKNYSPEERVKQDRFRGRKSRVEKTPGDWLWVFLFKEAADQRMGLLAQFMYETAARISQALSLRPEDLRLTENKVVIPAAKGYPDQEITISDELSAELTQLEAKRPRRTSNPNQNRPLLVFGYASRASVYKKWKRICDAAGIDHRMPHAAGRHGFATEMLNRQGIDPHTVAKLGRWKDVKLLFDTYGHSENGEEEILTALRTGRVQTLQRMKEKDNDNNDL
ncbi:tyrosine-type recombinase/integrase [Pseudovibrio denitrificans]|uniref:tyrosine-type recombinase/integrase n=1 Tax=Pseudovibrio denitrificans TaxID=258256 RepID=UPI0039BFE45B